MVFEETVFPRFSDLDRTGRISLGSLPAILEDVGGHHLHSLREDVGLDATAGLAWFCTNWQIRIDALTPGIRPYRVRTWTRKKHSNTTVLRDFQLVDPSGKVVVRAEAKYALMDKGTPVPITEEMLTPFSPEEECVFEAEMAKIIPPESFSIEKLIGLRRSDIDFYGHVHNTRYLDLALEAFSEEPVEQLTREIRIAFRRPVRQGDSLKVLKKPNEDGWTVVLRSEREDHCYLSFLTE